GNRALAILNPLGDLIYNFGFVPRVDLAYNPAEVGFGAAMSAQFLSLNGTLERTVTTANGAADLTATGNLTLVLVTIAEVNKPFFLADLTDRPFVSRWCLEDDSFV